MVTPELLDCPAKMEKSVMDNGCARTVAQRSNDNAAIKRLANGPLEVKDLVFIRMEFKVIYGEKYCKCHFSRAPTLKSKVVEF